MPACLAGIEPAHIRAGRKFHAGFDDPLHQIGVAFVRACIRFGFRSPEGGRHHYAWLHDLREKAAVEGRRHVEENAFVSHLLQLLVGCPVAVFYRVRAGINRGLNADAIYGVDGNLEVLTMCLLDNRYQFRDRDVPVDTDLDEIYVIEDVLQHCLPRPVRAVYQQEFLLYDRMRKSGVEVLNVVTQRDELASRRQDPWPGHAAGIDGVAQHSVAIDTGVPEIAYRGEAALQVFARHLRSQKRALGRRFRYCQQ